MTATFDETPCPRRTLGLPCIRSFTEPVCITCRRDLPLTHPTTADLPAMLRERAGLPPLDPVDPQFALIQDMARQLSERPPTVEQHPERTPEEQRAIAAARRIKRALWAEADRRAGITRRPLIASLPALLASLERRHDLPMRVIADLLDEVVPMLELLARVREIVDGAKDGSAMAWLDGYADIRDVLYPDTEVAREQSKRRNMTPAELATEREAADAAEREAWAGIRDPADIEGEQTLHRCCHPECPGYPYRASEMAHPCGRSDAEQRFRKALLKDVEQALENTERRLANTEPATTAGAESWSHPTQTDDALADLQTAIEQVTEPICPTCGMTLAHFAGPGDARGLTCVRCNLLDEGR